MTKIGDDHMRSPYLESALCGACMGNPDWTQDWCQQCTFGEADHALQSVEKREE